jgi:hypothetical protein
VRQIVLKKDIPDLKTIEENFDERNEKKMAKE